MFATMLELRLVQATFFKNVLEALSDLFIEAHFDFSRTGLELQAIDINRVALVLRAEAFNHYLCDHGLSMGLNLADMAKAFRYANNDDIITIKAEEDWTDTVTFTFESLEDGEILEFDFDFVGSNGVPLEISEYQESEYQAIVRMPSAKFMRICKKLSSFEDIGDRDPVIAYFLLNCKIWVEVVYYSAVQVLYHTPKSSYSYADDKLGGNVLSMGDILSFVRSLPTMIVMDEIGKQVELSLEAANLAQRNATLGISDSSAHKFSIIRFA
ncbi:hypothetical protein C2845_PM07G32080 [Panicum miliaceum]|uniref:DNA sliding clamp PCNA n=1 Tax=Panicum miliaceum TaxID=4540 RepID=A0A3L6STX7_PANMI|nr:hypothetical protein C2845_PM07G32080 [Panicum miliaceum]